MELGEKIKQNRKKMNLTQQEVADKVFVTRQTISKWELGKSRPDLVSLKLLEHIFSASLLSEKKETWNMKFTVKDFLVTLFFGIWFLPLRIVYTLLRPYFSNRLVQMLVIPTGSVVFILYVRSLKSTPMMIVLGIVLMIYYFLIFFYGGKYTGASDEHMTNE